MCGAAPTNIDLRPSGSCTGTACTMHLAQACSWSCDSQQHGHQAIGTGGAHLRMSVLHDAGESHLKSVTKRQRHLLLVTGLEDKGQVISPDIGIAGRCPASTPAIPPDMLRADPLQSRTRGADESTRLTGHRTVMYSAGTRLVSKIPCCSKLRNSAAYNTCGGFAALLEFTGAGPEAFPLKLRISAAGPGVMGLAAN